MIIKQFGTVVLLGKLKIVSLKLFSKPSSNLDLTWPHFCSVKWLGTVLGLLKTLTASSELQPFYSGRFESIVRYKVSCSMLKIRSCYAKINKYKYRNKTWGTFTRLETKPERHVTILIVILFFSCSPVCKDRSNSLLTLFVQPIAQKLVPTIDPFLSTWAAITFSYVIVPSAVYIHMPSSWPKES